MEPINITRLPCVDCWYPSSEWVIFPVLFWSPAQSGLKISHYFSSHFNIFISRPLSVDCITSLYYMEFHWEPGNKAIKPIWSSWRRGNLIFWRRSELQSSERDKWDDLLTGFTVKIPNEPLHSITQIFFLPSSTAEGAETNQQLLFLY